MSKALLLSIIVATVALPLYAGTARRPGRALRNTVFLLFVFNALYLFAVRFIFPRLNSI
ncbi:MAG: hypothetical protein ACT4TC_05990 [Myxococcaceae bacterium]